MRCYDIRKKEVEVELKPFEEVKDIGAGKHPRFQVSDTILLKKDEVKESVQQILDLCNRFHTEFRHRNNMDEEMLHRVNYFTAECMKINGIGSLRGQMMVQLCALFGLVPLHFYTYLPIHLNGGPGHFMKDGMNWGKGNRKSNLLRWNADIMAELHSLYNKELTYNMLENAACEIGRNTTPNDLHFNIPRVEDVGCNSSLSSRLKINFGKRRLQFYFRVDGNRNNNWKLQMFAGGKNKITVFPERTTSKNGSYFLSWTRAQSNGCLARSTKIKFNERMFATLDKSLS